MKDGFDAATLKQLWPQTLPPSNVDIERALLEGRRRAHARRLVRTTAVTAGVCAAVTGLGVVAVQRGADMPATVVPSSNGCEVRQLPTPGGGPATVVAVDPSGRFAVGAPDRGVDAGPADDVVLVWTDGVLRAVTGAPAPHPSAAAVQRSGVVAGNSGTSVPWVFRDGTFTRLAVPPGIDRASADAVDAAGDVVGTVSKVGQDGRDVETSVVRWKSETPGVYELVTSGPALSRASAVGEDGTVVGHAVDADGNSEAYAWRRDGTAQNLLSADGQPAEFATGIAGDWVIGTYEDADPSWRRGVRWNLRTGEVRELGTFLPGAVDAAGEVSGVLLGAGGDERPALWKDGTVLELPVLPGRQSAVVTSMSADGRTVVGWLSHSKDDPVVPVRWTCR